MQQSTTNYLPNSIPLSKSVIHIDIFTITELHRLKQCIKFIILCKN